MRSAPPSTGVTMSDRVDAVAEALFVHRDADVFYADIWKNYGCECGWSSELDDADSLREHQAEAVMAALDKYDEEHGVDLMAYVEARRTEADLRERIAQEIEAGAREDVAQLSRHALDNLDHARLIGATDAWAAAAHITRRGTA